MLDVAVLVLSNIKSAMEPVLTVLHTAESCFGSWPFELRRLRLPHRQLEAFGAASAPAASGFGAASAQMPDHRQLRRRLWPGARWVTRRLPVLQRGRAHPGGMQTFRSVSVSEWHQREVRDGLRRATIRDKLRMLQGLRLACPAEQQALHETVLAVRTLVDEMDAEELDFFRRARLCHLW